MLATTLYMYISMGKLLFLPEHYLYLEFSYCTQFLKKH